MPPAERRTQLLDAALQIINSQGVAAVSVDAVSRLCGVTRPVFYTQFTDTQHLLRTLLDRETRCALDQIMSATPIPTGAVDPVRWFVEGTRAVVAAVAERPSTWRAILLPIGEVPDPVHTYLQQAEETITVRFAEIIRFFLQGREHTDEVDVELLARLLLRLLGEAGRLVLEDSSDYPPDRIIRFAATVAEGFFIRYPEV